MCRHYVLNILDAPWGCWLGDHMGHLAHFARKFTLVDLPRVNACCVTRSFHVILCVAPTLQVWLHLDECRTTFGGALAHTPNTQFLTQIGVQTPMHTTFDTLWIGSNPFTGPCTCVGTVFWTYWTHHKDDCSSNCTTLPKILCFLPCGQQKPIRNREKKCTPL
jgi:hypothetical protein